MSTIADKRPATMMPVSGIDTSCLPEYELITNFLALRESKSENNVQGNQRHGIREDEVDADLTPEPQPDRHADLNESEDGVVLNLTSNDQESGEISESSSQANYVDADQDSELGDHGQDYPLDIRGGSDSDQQDAMVEYSNANQAINPASIEPQLEGRSGQADIALTLAHLNEEDFQAQIRYFYVAKDSKTIDFMTTLVKCLVCSGEGHMAAGCPKLSCADCGAYNDHFPPFCPESKRCPRCQERGHSQVDCKSKLRALVTEATCGLCSTAGHVTDDCELLWRTSGAPAVVNVSDNRMQRLSCYECGRAHHLGNDCPMRRPGKPMGTSTWGISSKAQAQDQISIRSHGEMSIKGRAKQQKPISINSDSDDDRNDFVRPKVPAPAKSGQIRIQAPRPDNRAPTSTWTSTTDPHRGPARYTHKQEYSDYRLNDPQLRSSRHQDHNHERAHRSRPLSTHRNPPPPRTIDHYSGGGQPYHPMPSAGPNAWRQHRI